MRSSSVVLSDGADAGAAAGPWAAPAAGGDRPLDLVHLTRQTFGDKRLETELLRLFLRQAEQVGRTLELAPGERAAGQGDLDLVHLLAGSARAVGATKVAARSSAAEASLRRDAGARAVLGEDERRDLKRAIVEAAHYVAELLDQG